jgi:hypothetical protein
MKNFAISDECPHMHLSKLRIHLKTICLALVPQLFEWIQSAQTPSALPDWRRWISTMHTYSHTAWEVAKDCMERLSWNEVARQLALERLHTLQLFLYLHYKHGHHHLWIDISETLAGSQSYDIIFIYSYTELLPFLIPSFWGKDKNSVHESFTIRRDLFDEHQ